MRKCICWCLSFMLTGCSSLLPAPSATTGWVFQIGSPSLVHVPVITDQQTQPTNTTNVGTHRVMPTGNPTAPPTVPVIPVPRPSMTPAGGPCGG